MTKYKTQGSCYSISVQTHIEFRRRMFLIEDNSSKQIHTFYRQYIPCVRYDRKIHPNFSQIWTLVESQIVEYMHTLPQSVYLNWIINVELICIRQWVSKFQNVEHNVCTYSLEWFQNDVLAHTAGNGNNVRCWKHIETCIDTSASFSLVDRQLRYPVALPSSCFFRLSTF